MSFQNPTTPGQPETLAHQDDPAFATLGPPAGPVSEPYGEEEWLPESEELPRRPRRRMFTPLPLTLLAVLLVALGFIGGALVEKGQSSSSSAASTQGSALATRLRALGGSRGALGGTSSSSGAGAASGFTRPTVGTVSYLEGSTLYVTNAEGNTVKVTTSAATGVTKNSKASISQIHPGESVTITGQSGSGGAISAEAITVGSAASPFAGLFGSRTSSGGSSSSGTSGPALFGNGG